MIDTDVDIISPKWYRWGVITRFIDRVVRHIYSWSIRKSLIVIVLGSVVTSVIASIAISLISGDAVTSKNLLRAFVIPLVVAIFMGSIWMRFVQYLRQTETALRESESRYRAVLAALPDIMFHVDRNGRFLHYHVSHIEILWKPPEVFIGKSVCDLFPKALADQFIADIARALDTGQVVSLEYELHFVDVPRFFEARFAALNTDTVLAIVRDITAQKDAEAALVAERATLAQRVEERTAALRETNLQLVMALRARSEFLATVSHELRTPLTAIIAFADLLRRHTYGPLNGRQQNVLGDIGDSGKHLLNLINDILDFSKVEAGQSSLDIVALDVVELCRDSLKLVEPIAQQKQLQLSLSLDENVSTIQGDSRRLKQVLVNLLSNAVKFTPKGGGAVGLEVRGDVNLGTVDFTVWDTGIGIATDDIERIFQPFVQLDSSVSRAYEGTGLGLALVYCLVELHGGAISVTSELGEGSRFTVSLPWDTSATLSAAKPAATSMGVPMFTASSTLEHRPLILVAEDNRLNRKVLCDLLTTVGYRVITAEDGTMAVQAAREHHPDLVLMDIQMPGVNGLEATRHIRADATLRDIPIIALTALAMPGDRERCIAAGTTDYVSKPIDAVSLLAIVHKVLSHCAHNEL